MPPGSKEDNGLRTRVEQLEKFVYIGNGRPSLLDSVRENSLKTQEIEKDVKEIKEEQKALRNTIEENHKTLLKGQNELFKHVMKSEKDVAIKLKNNQLDSEKNMATLAQVITIAILVFLGGLILFVADIEQIKSILKLALSLV